MRVVVAMDSFKGSLDAEGACAAVERGLRSRIPGVDVVRAPMADGGEGTAQTLIHSLGGRWREVEATGPLGHRRVAARFVSLARTGTDGKPGALVEMAQASGLELITEDERNPMVTTTRGTGELLAAAAGEGALRIWLAIGGSATVDGGTGAARALGWRFLGAHGDPVPEGGRGLEAVERIVPPASDPLAGVEVEVLCDVDNPLLGPRGAAAIFGPQKGATPAMVDELERGLANLARVIQSDLGQDVRTIPGAGAAGGLGAGAVAFFGARLVSGVDAVMNASGLDAALAGADWVVTGEGRLDDQSLHGKVVSGVVRRAQAAGARVAALAGSLALSPGEARSGGVEAVEAASPPEMPLAEAMARAEELVEAAAGRLADRMAAPGGGVADG